MSKMWIHGIALVLLIAALPLISIGTMQDSPVLWWTGLVLLVAAGAVTPVTRYVLKDENGKGAGDDDGEDSDDEGAGDGDNDDEATGESETS